MPSIEPVEIKPVDDSISLEQPPQILSQQNSSSANVKKPVSRSAEPTENSFIQNKQRVIPKPLCYLMYCLLFVCLAPVAYAFIAVVTVAILPLLLVAFVVIRLFHIIVTAENYDKRIIVMALLRFSTFVVVMLLLVEVGLFYPIAKYVPRLKLVMIIGLPITKWIKVICMLIGIFLIGKVISVSIIWLLTEIIPQEAFIITESISEIIGCLLFWWAEVVVMSSVPTFKQSKIFGIYTQQWVKVSLLALIGYNIITLLTHLFVWLLRKMCEYPLKVGQNIKSIFNIKYIVYTAIGIKRSVVFILSTVMLLITWMVCFGNHLGTAPQNQRLLDFGTWTFVSLILCSFLWFFKSCLLLYWEAHNVYNRLHPKIRDIGKQLYFLMMVRYGYSNQLCRFFTLHLDHSKPPPKVKVSWNLPKDTNEDSLYREFDRKTVRAEFIDYTSKMASIYDIQKAAQRFLTAQSALLNERTVAALYYFRDNDSDNYSRESNVGRLYHLVADFYRLQDNDAKYIQSLKEVVQVEGDPYFDEDWEMLLELLPDVHTPEDITFKKVKTFMERAHSRCMFLTNTLISEIEVVKCLNQVTSGIIIAVTCIMWLLLTGLATTKVLVLIASPLLAATFIFGDTAKNLFQGLIFVYVFHPFNVGDLCLIDDKLLEVQRIGIWSTVFANIRTVDEQQQIIYPNSVLALKNIVNHKTNFDWNDNIQFITSPDNKITEPLRHKIETYLDDEIDKFTPNFHSVDILEMGEKAKIVVHIKHKFKTTEGWTYFECLKAKEKRRFEFAVYVQKLVKQVESETKTPESLAEMEDKS